MKITLDNLIVLLKKLNLNLKDTSNSLYHFYMNNSKFVANPNKIYKLQVDPYRTNNVFSSCEELIKFMENDCYNIDNNVYFCFYIEEYNQKVSVIFAKMFNTFNKQRKHNNKVKTLEAIQLLPVTNISGSEYKQAENDFTELNKSSKKLN